MHFDLSEDQHDIKRTAHDLLASRATWAKVREAAEAGREDDALWRELGELGWPGIAVAEEHDGQGMGVLGLAVLAEELGYACAPVPYLGTTLAALAIEHAGSDEQRTRWLGKLASGEVTGALVIAADGVAAIAPGVTAEALVVVADGAGGAVVHEPGAGAVTAVESVDPTRLHGLVTGGAAGGEPLPGDVDAVLDRAAVVVAAELVGVCQRALEMTLEYVKDRKQFGVAVGTYQAVQHTAAQMLRDTEGARVATLYAAWTADAEPASLPVAAAMAKAAASEAGRAVTASAIQLHGGIGFTWEADVHWLFKRAQVDSALLGSASAHRARITELVAASRSVAA